MIQDEKAKKFVHLKMTFDLIHYCTSRPTGILKSSTALCVVKLSILHAHNSMPAVVTVLAILL